MGKKVIAAVAVVLGLVLALQLSGVGTNTDYASAGQEHKLQKEKVSELMNLFAENLTEQKVDKRGRVLHFSTKAELLNTFSDFAEPAAVKPFLDELYREQDGKLYLNPTEWPPAFNKQRNYDMVELTKDRAEVKQTLNSALYGNLMMRIHFHYSEGTWKIAKLEYEQAVE